VMRAARAAAAAVAVSLGLTPVVSRGA
jgi:hypothetical protein